MSEPVNLEPLAKDEIDVLGLLVVLAKSARLLLLGSLMIGLLALGISFLIKPTYTATTRLLPPQQQQGAAAMLAQQLGSLAGLAGVATGIKNPVDVYVAMLQSRTVADRVVDRFKLVDLYEVEYREDAREKLASRTRVNADKNGTISVEVDDHDPARAAGMANAYVDELEELTKTLAVTEAGQRRLFFEAQLKQAKEDLAAAEIALGSSGVGASALKADPRAAVEGIARLKAEIAAAEVKLASMRGYLTNNSVEIRQAQHELSALNQQLAKFERSDVTAVQDEGAEYISKYRTFKYHETLFELMAQQYEMAKLDEAREGAVLQVIDAAQPPERKAKPKKAFIAVISTIAGFFMLLIWVLVKSSFERAQLDPQAAEKVQSIRRALLTARSSR